MRPRELCEMSQDATELVKNVTDKQDALWQIVLGSLNPVYCVLSSLALCLELNLKSNPAVAMSSPCVFGISDDIRVPEGGLKLNAMIQNALKVMFKGEQFKCAEEEEAALILFGSHSVRKYAATYAWRCGATKDEKDIRGRWKGQGRVLDIYDDVELSYPDEKVAEKLCGGGPCFYLCNPTLDVAMMILLVLSHVVLNIKKQLPESACIVLGNALLWLICSPVVDKYIPKDLKRKVLSEWEHVRGNNVDAELNPIEEMAVVVLGNHGAVYIDMLCNLEEENAGGGGVVPGMNVSVRNLLLGVPSALLAMQQENLELKTSLSAVKVYLERGFEVVNGIVR